MADIALFDPILIPDITIIAGDELLAACQDNENKKVTIDLIKDFIRPYREFRAKLWQAASPVFTVRTIPLQDELNNNLPSTDPLYMRVVFSRLGVGQFDVKLRYKLANTAVDIDKLEVSFSDNKVRVTGVNVGADGTSNYIQYLFSSYDTSWVEADLVMEQLTNIYVRLYN